MQPLIGSRFLRSAQGRDNTLVVGTADFGQRLAPPHSTRHQAVVLELSGQIEAGESLGSEQRDNVFRKAVTLGGSGQQYGPRACSDLRSSLGSVRM
jgi:hypothetical protein